MNSMNRCLGFAVPLSLHRAQANFFGNAARLHGNGTAKRVAPKMSTTLRYDRSIPETIEVGGYQIHGVSVGALETCICVPSLSLAFDAGKCPAKAVSMKYMAITHGHSDHVHGLPLHLATRNLQNLPAPKYFVPPDIAEDVRNFVHAVSKLERSSLPLDLQTLSPSQPSVELNKGWFLKAFETFHTVPSQGYLVYKEKKRLKGKYAGLSGKELAAIKAKGSEVDDFWMSPEIAFTGDTTVDAIARSAECRQARILITEMTFLDDQCSPADSKRFGHIHIDDIANRAELFKDNEHVLFTHFSARYPKETIRKAIKSLPEPLRHKCSALGVSFV